MAEQARPSREPQPGIDYPRTVAEFHDAFPDEDACLRFLERLRWPSQFVCPACQAAGVAWRSQRGLLLCSRCRYQASVTAGTVFEGTRTPLRQWFLAAWEVTSHKYGASALGVQRVLGLGSYKTAWAWLHKLRRAMVRPDRDRLAGEVEVDETYLGGKEAGVHGRETAAKAIVAVAAEVKEDKRIGRIRLRHVPNVSATSLVGFVSDVAAQGTVVRTDGWGGYGGLASAGFEHRVTVLSASSDPAHVLMPAVHRVASLLKRWWLGTLQGAISKQQLEYYLDEFTFRFNRRTSRARGLLWYRLLSQAVATPHVPTAALFRGSGRGPKGASRRGDHNI